MRLKIKVLLIIVLAYTSSSYSQQQKIDSLQLIINNRAGIDKYDPMISLVRLFAENDFNKALKVAEEANQIASKFGDTVRIVNSSRIIGQLFNRLSRHKEAEEILLRTIPIAKRNKLREEYKVIMNNLALSYTIQAKYDKALTANFQTLELREIDKDSPADISISLNNIGLVYFKLNDFVKALEFYDRSLKLKKEGKDNYDLDRLLINIGLCHNYLKDYSKAQEFFDMGLESCEGECSWQIIAEGELGLGLSYYGLGNFSEAKNHFNKSYSIAKKIDNKRFQAENLISLVRIYIGEEDNEAAIAALKECEEMSLATGNNEVLIDTYNEFSKIFTKLKNFKKASYYQSLYINLKDSVHSEQLTINLMKVEAEHLERENLARIASQNQILVLKEEVIDRQQLINIFIGGVVLMLTLLSAILIRINRQKQMINKILDEKVKERTRALSESHDALIKANKERDILMEQSSIDINNSLAKIKGLCTVGLQDISDPDARRYISKVSVTFENLAFTVKNFRSLIPSRAFPTEL